MSKTINTHALYALNHRTNDEGIVERRCTNCQEWKAETVDNFYYVNKKVINKRFTPECKECAKKRSLRDRHKDIELTRRRDRETYYRRSITEEWKLYNRLKGSRQRESGYQKGWRQRNPDKVKIYASLHRYHDITSTEERSLLKVFEYKCAYCGMTEKEHKIKFEQKLHNDHVDTEGYNDLRNDVPACKSCNCSKWEHPFEEWYKSQKFYNEERYNKIIWWTTEGYKDYIEDKPPYRIIKKQNDRNKKFHHELWLVDEMRNMVECIDIKDKKKDLDLNLVLQFIREELVMSKMYLSEPNFEDDYDILTQEDCKVYVIAEHVKYIDAMNIIERYNSFEGESKQ